jgi:glycosyltransferase involved in cell wall biosynthesis
MQRLKIYIVTDGPYSGTGFGEQMRQIGFLLAQTGLFEVYWQSLQHMGYPYDLPDSVFPDLPHKGSVIHMLPTYGNPTDFGSFIFPKHFSKYSPDIVIFMGDPKNIHSWIPMKQKVPFYMMFYTTLDGLPVPSYWNTEFFKNVDFLLAMSEWATNEFIKAGVKVKGYIHHGVNTDFWQQDLEEKYNMRRRFGIRDDTVLFVDRNTNQHRKRQDVLLKCWRDARPESKNMKLLLWMDWHCYSDDTEVLTSDGWKLFKDVTYEDKIATLNPTLNNLEYHKPITIIKKKYRGNMFHQKSRSIDLLVTPQHDLWVSRTQL